MSMLKIWNVRKISSIVFFSRQCRIEMILGVKCDQRAFLWDSPKGIPLLFFMAIMTLAFNEPVNIYWNVLCGLCWMVHGCRCIFTMYGEMDVSVAKKKKVTDYLYFKGVL